LITGAGTSKADETADAAFLKTFDRDQVLGSGFLLRSG